ncbi:hypothetical protein ACH42_01815 [Endozoicomonas sp. (ex Bugula neritina AB1)]|nr:hypothetical protein ACH42_01815 [Endozoicomonas sp. (ex Bugula neritina AB1)]
MHYGLDIGGTKIEIAIFDKDFNIQSTHRTPTPTQDYSDFLNTVKELINHADQENNTTGTIGIGIPGALDATTGQVLTSNIPCTSGKLLKQDLETVLQRPVAIENDCRCFTYSEAIGGSAHDQPRVFGAILGTGLGGAFCINQSIYSGAQRVSGEWGHTPIAATIQQKYQLPLLQCGCGLSGCNELYISGPGLARLYRLYGGEDLTTPDIIGRYRQGENTAVTAFSTFIDMTAAAMANLVFTFDPNAIVIGGGLSQVPELYKQLPDAMKPYLFGNLVPPAILAPEFGDSGGVRGAAILGASA